MSTPTDSPAEWERLAAINSVAAIVASQVADFVRLRKGEIPSWLSTLGVPSGWRIAQYPVRSSEFFELDAPSRVAVATPQTRQIPGYGCETITVFAFTGSPVLQDVYDYAACSLEDLGAAGVVVSPLRVPAIASAIAVRCSGYIVADNVEMWAQYSNYIVSSDKLNWSRLVQHCLFIRSAEQFSFAADIVDLSDAAYRAFFAAAQSKVHWTG